MQAIDILSRWPSRRAVAEDAKASLATVHKWFERNRIPSEHDVSLVTGGKARGVRVSFEELAAARAAQRSTAA